MIFFSTSFLFLCYTFFGEFMEIKNGSIEIDEALKLADVDNIILKRRNNGFLLSDYQISILNRNSINFEKYNNLDELIFEIEEILNINYDEELDLVGSQLAEYKYYKDTKK